MGILLSLIAPFLFLICSPLNLLVVLFKNYKAHGFWKVVNKYSLDSAVNVDKFGNYNLSPLFNAALIKKEGYKFGDPLETISSVLGKNQRDKTLTIVGWVIVYILWIVDIQYILKKGHCINSIKEE